MLDSRYAMWMLWGPELTFFCNDAYLPTLGIKGTLGARQPLGQGLGGNLAGYRTAHRAGAQARAGDLGRGLLLFLERSGFSEETYHTFSYSPVYNDENQIAGMLCVVTEVTDRVIDERRLRVLRDLAARAVGVESVEESCQRLCEALAQYPLDMPFAALYLIDADRAAGAAAWRAPATAAGPSAAGRSWRSRTRSGRWRELIDERGGAGAAAAAAARHRYRGRTLARSGTARPGAAAQGVRAAADSRAF